MMSKQFLFYDIEIYFILYHAFFILSDDSLLPYLLPDIEKRHQMMTFQRKKLFPLYFKDLNVFFEQWIKETVCVFKKGFKDLGFQVHCIFEMIFNFWI
ncbi:hypothetical protein AZK31_11365 [Streptococcus pneumoniae]|nr:hypothetical protein AZK31_11365 [Streptococcus pneumoniae]